MIDRKVDYSAPLQHVWTYSGLVQEFFGINLNKIVLTVTSEGDQKTKKVYDIDMHDKFWRENASASFPEVMDNIHKELEDYKTEMEKMKQDPTGDIKSAMTMMPEMIHRKKLIDMHMNIVMSILDHIKSRSIDSFFENENTLNGKQVLAFLQDSKGTKEDKMRLFLVYFLSSAPKQNVDQMIECLKGLECDMRAYEFLRQHYDFLKQSKSMKQEETNLFQRLGIKESSMLSGVLDTMMTGVKTLLPVKTDCLLSATAEKMLKGDAAMFDPRSKAVVFDESVTDLVVFVVGGLTYPEYENLKMHFKVNHFNVRKIIRS